MAKIKDNLDKQYLQSMEENLSMAELDMLDKMDNETFVGNSNIDITNLSHKFMDENIEENEKLKAYKIYIEENDEIFSDDEKEKLKSDEAFDLYMTLTNEQKAQLFPLSNFDFSDEELANGYIKDDIDELNDLAENFYEENDSEIDFD